MVMDQIICGFDRDDDDQWRARLQCGHYQHVRHLPPLSVREWVLDPEERSKMLGKTLACKKCDIAAQKDFDHSLILTADHESLDELLNAAFDALLKQDKDRIFACIDMFWARLAMHIRAEHLHLFPAIKNAVKKPNTMISAKKASAMIEMLHKDHDLFMRELIEIIKQLRENAYEYESISLMLTGIGKRLVSHNMIEEKEVYGWAESLLTEKEYRSLQSKMLKEIINLPPRFLH
jgi:hemerythrin superfamily protein